MLSNSIEELIYYCFIILNILYSIYLIYWLIVKKYKEKKSMRYSYYLLSLTLILLILVPLAEALAFLQNWPWELIKMIALFLFIINLHITMKKMDQSILAYETISRKK